MAQVIAIAFDNETTAALEIAYNKVFNRFPGDRYSDLRQIIAKRIIAAVQTGERDPNRIYTSALASIGFPVRTSRSSSAEATSSFRSRHLSASR
jgi:hypothetical protein